MKKVILFGVILIIVLLGIFALSNFKNNTGNSIRENVKEITLQATRFQYSPEVINVGKGDRVIINVENIDTLHGIRIPDFNVRDENRVEFIADKTGEFYFYCAVFCGEEHKEMKGKLIVK